MRFRLYQIVQKSRPGDIISYVYDIFMIVIAFLSITPMLFRLDEVDPTFAIVINCVDIITVYILLIDYILRWTTHDIRRCSIGKNGGIKSFFIYPFTPMAIIDLFAILPSLIFLPGSLKFLRLLRIFKILRISKGFTMISNVFIRESRQLLSVFGFTVFYIFIIALIMFVNEPSLYDNFLNAIYWSTTCLTGYNDFPTMPTTEIGSVIVEISSLLGVIIVIAVPSAIFIGGYVDELRRQDEEKKQQKLLAKKISASKQALNSQAVSYIDFLKTLKQKLPKIKNIKNYFKNKPKVQTYIKIIIFALVIDIIFVIIYFTFPIIAEWFYLDCIIVCAVSMILEPIVGILLSIVFIMNNALAVGDPSYILYVGSYVANSLLFGIFLHRSKKITFAKILIIFVLSFLMAVLLTSATNNYLIHAFSPVNEMDAELYMENFIFYPDINLPFQSKMIVIVLFTYAVQLAIITALSFLLKAGISKLFKKDLASFDDDEIRGRASIFYTEEQYNLAVQNQKSQTGHPPIEANDADSASEDNMQMQNSSTQLEANTSNAKVAVGAIKAAKESLDASLEVADKISSLINDESDKTVKMAHEAVVKAAQAEQEISSVAAKIIEKSYNTDENQDQN